MTPRPCLWPPCSRDAAAGEAGCDEHRGRISRMTKADVLAAIIECDRLARGGRVDRYWVTPTERQRVLA